MEYQKSRRYTFTYTELISYIINGIGEYIEPDEEVVLRPYGPDPFELAELIIRTKGDSPIMERHE